MNDLLKCGIPEQNIRVFDLHANMMTQNVIGGLFLLAIGILLLLRPRSVWAVTERWKYAGAAEASPVFLIVARAFVLSAR